MTDENTNIGHNGGPDMEEKDAIQQVAADRLKSFIERVERLEEEKAALTADIREVYAEAKSTGFDPKIMRMIVRLRKMDQASREEQEHLLSLYRSALEL